MIILKEMLLKTAFI